MPQPPHLKSNNKGIPSKNADVEAWLRTSRESQDPLAALESIQRARDLDPNDPRVQASLQAFVFETLKNDPSVAFLAETEGHYVVTLRNSRPVLIPKSRAQPISQPSAQRTDGERVLNSVWWIVLGFLLLGVGAFLTSLLVLRSAFRLLKRNELDPRDRRLAWLAVALATALGLVGEFFTLLLMLHFVD